MTAIYSHGTRANCKERHKFLIALHGDKGVPEVLPAMEREAARRTWTLAAVGPHRHPGHDSLLCDVFRKIVAIKSVALARL
jgi:hypothetical protein